MVSGIIIAVLGLVHIFFLIALLRKNFAVMDICWGLGFIVIALVAYMHHPVSVKSAILLAVIAIWGVRLASYIFIRSLGRPEDPRYTKFRHEWRPHENLQAYLKVFLFQGFLMLVVSLPVTSSMALEPKTITWVNWIGLGLWGIGLGFESWADAYLVWWKAQAAHKGKICTTGPWALCRFPNYFGEVLLWYGIYFLSLEISNAWSVIGPVTINFMIYKVTGVPLLENKYREREDYLEYCSRVPKFVPFTKP